MKVPELLMLLIAGKRLRKQMETSIQTYALTYADRLLLNLFCSFTLAM
jgi:hypothetical protein